MKLINEFNEQPASFGAGHKRCGLGRGRTSAERASSLPLPTLNKMARLKERGKMYNDNTWHDFEKKYKDKEKIINSDRKKLPYTWYVLKYGEEIAEGMLEKQRKKQKETAPKKNPLKIVNDFKPKKNKHKQKPINGQFLALPYDNFFNNEDLMKKIGNKTGLLLVLLRNIVDWNKNERLNLYQEFFVKRKLIVASISRHRLAEMFGREVRRITEWAKSLEKDGIIKIERIPCIEDDDHRKKYNVYILGKVNDDGSYTFYYEK